jgi:two-component sensor histidine kinase
MVKLQYYLLVFIISTAAFCQEAAYIDAENYFKNNQYENATTKIQKAIKNTNKNKSKYYMLYANILKSKNVGDSSLYYYNLMEADYTRRNITDSLLLTLALKVEFYRYYDNRKVADSYLKKIDSFPFNQIENKDIVAFALNRKLAILNAYHNKSIDTIKLISTVGKQILDLKDMITKKEIVAYTLNELAQFEDYNGDKIKALKLYKEALAYAQNNDVRNPEIDCSLNLSRYYANRKDFSAAIQTLEALEDKVVNGANIFQKYYLFLNLKNLYFFNKDYKKAYLALEKCNAYENEISWNESMVKLKASERKYDLAKKQKELLDKESEIKIQNITIETSNKKFWLILVIFLIAAAASAALFYFFKREKYSNKELRILSTENEFLMSEANHRINNNLQLIIILISAQIEKLNQNENDEIKKILVKINAIATLHKHLYKSKNKKEIDVQKYLKDIESSFLDLFAENKIISSFSTQQMSLIIDDAMYIGLILTELYINSIKHAFTQKQTNKQIFFSISLQDDMLAFSYMDNGKNSTDHPKPDLKPVLVDQLCRQLEVAYEITSGSGFQLVFRKAITLSAQKNKS